MERKYCAVTCSDKYHQLKKEYIHIPRNPILKSEESPEFSDLISPVTVTRNFAKHGASREEIRLPKG